MTTHATAEFEARAGVVAYIVLGICFGIPAFVSIFVMLLRPEVALQWVFPLCVGILALSLCYVWLAAFRVRISDEYLTYRTLFSNDVAVRISNVSDARVTLDYDPWNNMFKPKHRLDLFLEGDREPAVSINLKVFSSRDVRHVLAALDNGRDKKPAA